MKKLFSIVSLFLLSVSAFGQVTIFTETMGTAPSTTTIAAHESANGFDNDGFTMTGTADVRNTLASSGYSGASGLGNVFFGTSGGNAKEFQIEGINTSNYTSLSLSFGVLSTVASSALTIEVSSDGTNYTALSYTAPSNTTWNLVTATGTIPSASNLRIKFSKNSTTSWRIDDLKLTGVVANLVPTASSVSFSGTLTQGQILTGAYTYSDSENDVEGTSTFKWYRSDDASGTNKTEISGAVNLTFSPTASEVGKYISFEVSPVAATGSTTGAAVESSKQGPITASSNNAPVASGVTISGTVKEGQTLTGNYTYSDIENDVQGTSTFKWFRSNDGSGTGKSAISGATNATYNLTTLDAGKYISFEVTPVASTGTVLGNAVESSLVGPVEALPNDAPVASNVTFSGSLFEGQTLTGSYTYSDTENNTEGSSTKKWYRSDDASGTNQSEISGATALTYQLTASDLGKYISFEVTPVATVGTLTGSAAASTRQGPVLGTPTITTVGTLTSFGTVGNNTISAEKTYKVTAKNLTTDLVVTAPTDYKISLTTGSGFVTSLNLTPSSGTVDTTTIYVVFAPTSIGAKSGNITHTSTGATDKTITVTGTAAVALPIYESFSYTGASNLGGQGGWTNFNSGDEVVVASGNLSYTGMGESAGNKVTFGGAGIDPMITFASIAENKVYFSFLLNVTSLGSLNTTGGYFAGIAGSSSTFAATIWMRSTAGGGYNLGINPRTTTANTSWSTTEFPLSSTVLVSGSYEFVAGTANDIVRLWINPSVPTNEPTSDLVVTNTTGTDLTAIDRFFIRQDGTSATAGVIELDELRVATTWESAGLPVELTSLNLSKNSGGINLTWSTATESNNAGFEIEKSLNQIAWNKIGFIHGKGTTTEAQTYQFQIPQSELKGTKSWFRLKQVDFDGSASYSNILTYEEIPETFSVGQNYPNPFNPETTFRFNLSKNSNVKIVVSNVLGQQVAVAANREFNAGSNIEVPFNAAALSSGLYYYTITANGKSITKTMMLMK